jgi:hypothetical protein
LLWYPVYRHIWLNLLVDGLQFGYTHACTLTCKES